MALPKEGELLNNEVIMSSSTIETVYNVTERTKEILMTLHEKGEDAHPLITYTEKQNYKNILLDFRRGMVRIIDGKVFNGDILPPVRDSCGNLEKDQIENEGLNAAEKQAIQTHLSKFKHMFGEKIEHFSQYNSQEFLSISANRILSTVLGQNIAYYKAGVSNGKVCHFWSEEIAGEVHLCILVVDDGFSITRNADAENVCYLPGAMMVELKVPLSVIEEKAPITEKHITKALVSSTELFNLLHVNLEVLSLFDYGFGSSCSELEQLKNALDSFLDKNGSRHPFPNLGNQIREPDFKDILSEADVEEEVVLSEKQLGYLKSSLDDLFLPKLDDSIDMTSSDSVLSEHESGKTFPCSAEPIKESALEKLYGTLPEIKKHNFENEPPLAIKRYSLRLRAENKSKRDSGLHKKSNNDSPHEESIFLFLSPRSRKENSNPNFSRIRFTLTDSKKECSAYNEPLFNKSF